MTEFHLDTAGVVSVDTRVSEGRAPGTSHPFVITAWSDLDAFTQGYVEALFFTEQESMTGECGNSKGGYREGRDAPGFSDLAPVTLLRIVSDCAAFQGSSDWQAFLTLRDNGGAEGDDDQGGRDFWFTRNGHGAGFWAREPYTYASHAEALSDAAKAFGYVDAYVGDDGKVYL